ncbi:hypothetical protein SEA_LUCHADOR_80 [Mycobacterium phage Luchador]|uniref:Uncharacterized protein n=2 Tax=Luchadorvirus TaxID=2948807 RepID=A0A0F6WDX8_9CAUD|nr:hypothetical protein AVT52_gp24 [Mycobacterium phage Luchador]AKF14244.1 hypothetical protein SEA_LUCHADOR_80 [Mycobacterium phage Luchador]
MSQPNGRTDGHRRVEPRRLAGHSRLRVGRGGRLMCDGQEVWIVVDPDGRKLPYLADDLDDALRQHSENDGSFIEGVFPYGSKRVGVL